jgi:hypothetical protein
MVECRRRVGVPDREQRVAPAADSDQRCAIPSIAKVGRVHSPMLFLHSPEDEIVPYEDGRRLYDRAQPPERFVDVRGGHVDANQVDEAVFFSAIRGFRDEYGLRNHQE